MTAGVFNQSLHDWQNFYALLGGVTATLTGLIFVAVTLGVRLINDETSPEVRTFLTPPIFYLSLVLLFSALMNIPNQTPSALSLQLAALGLTGAGYSLSCAKSLKAFYNAGVVKRWEWLWDLWVPLLGSTWLVMAAAGLLKGRLWSLDAAAVGALLLTMDGLRNSWNVTLKITSRAS